MAHNVRWLARRINECDAPGRAQASVTVITGRRDLRRTRFPYALCKRNPGVAERLSDVRAEMQRLLRDAGPFLQVIKEGAAGPSLQPVCGGSCGLHDCGSSATVALRKHSFPPSSDEECPKYVARNRVTGCQHVQEQFRHIVPCRFTQPRCRGGATKSLLVAFA
jgi:hypothetical protein